MVLRGIYLNPPAAQAFAFQVGIHSPLSNPQGHRVIEITRRAMEFSVSHEATLAENGFVLGESISPR